MKSERQDPCADSRELTAENNAAEEVIAPEGVETCDTMTGDVETREDLEERLAETEAKAAENWNMYLRALADLNNYQRRMARDLAFHIRSGKKDMILKLLTVVDDMERALAAEADYEALREGVEMIMRKLLDILAAEGVEPIEAVGLPFDPNFHEAVAVCDDGDVDTDTVVDELRRGYTYEDEVIRASMVRVARPTDS
ncbi:MAG: nucleotide exchange factor GrpE [Firmicutes bacterium]|jgi:molecular chaperone GrpE|nr:nucleotide exchange factor GrpE [Bacillota bacterium]HXL04586.1 nucleotide exchange factor GrpE [Bacillota bacterium]